MTETEVSGWAVGWATFAAVMMMMAGVFQMIAAIAAIAEDELFVLAGDWVFSFDVTTWGWIHLIIGILLIAAGLGVVTGNVLARTVGVVLAAASAIANFAYLPWYPLWAVTIIAINVFVIWALTVHGRDVARV